MQTTTDQNHTEDPSCMNRVAVENGYADCPSRAKAQHSQQRESSAGFHARLPKRYPVYCVSVGSHSDPPGIPSPSLVDSHASAPTAVFCTLFETSQGQIAQRSRHPPLSTRQSIVADPVLDVEGWLRLLTKQRRGIKNLSMYSAELDDNVTRRSMHSNHSGSKLASLEERAGSRPDQALGWLRAGIFPAGPSMDGQEPGSFGGGCHALADLSWAVQIDADTSFMAVTLGQLGDERLAAQRSADKQTQRRESHLWNSKLSVRLMKRTTEGSIDGRLEIRQSNLINEADNEPNIVGFPDSISTLKENGQGDEFNGGLVKNS
ncbi:uncharacterized protein CLUP02_06766 [Colletotrichum lupini]|uniref:Uncharacterized protein n=1 Tax=Colletotrichum lupini TaxID=145971 RepID=A0A9Q8SQM1_9PEZI|nr:uncharacterized protein CLUP02_06766 [Colletotrichum lupini]UQC81280.1 hypothetical protein CLUP02_06766 [Colletotrichum lupini]